MIYPRQLYLLIFEINFIKNCIAFNPRVKTFLKQLVLKYKICKCIGLQQWYAN